MRTVIRDRAVQIRVGRRERHVWRAAATAAGLTLSELIRECVRARIGQAGTRGPVAEVVADGGWDRDAQRGD